MSRDVNQVEFYNEKLAEIYDKIYHFKSYDREIAYVVDCVRRRLPDATSLLDVACGTGNHAGGLSATFELEEAGCTGDHEFLDLEGEVLEAEIWQGTADQIAFRDRVLEVHVAQRRRRFGAAKRDLSRAELGAVASTDGVEMALDAAASAGRLLTAANADLARAQASGHADALRTVRLSATSG